MDEKYMGDTNLRGEDVQTLRQILEHRFPPPKKGAGRPPSSLPGSQASVLEREEAPWWWSPSAAVQPSGRESRVLDSHHLLAMEMLARSVALSAQRARDRVHAFVQSMAKQRGEDCDEMLDAWDGFGLDFMPRIPKQPGNPPDASYFYKAKIEKDIQNVHIVLQYFAVLIEEILHDQEKFYSSTKTKWEEMADILKQCVWGSCCARWTCCWWRWSCLGAACLAPPSQSTREACRCGTPATRATGWPPGTCSTPWSCSGTSSACSRRRLTRGASRSCGTRRRCWRATAPRTTAAGGPPALRCAAPAPPPPRRSSCPTPGSRPCRAGPWPPPSSSTVATSAARHSARRRATPASRWIPAPRREITGIRPAPSPLPARRRCSSLSTCRTHWRPLRHPTARPLGSIRARSFPPIPRRVALLPALRKMPPIPFRSVAARRPTACRR